MRLAVAAAVLAHSLPATSETSITSSISYPGVSKKLEHAVFNRLSGMEDKSEGKLFSLLRETKARGVDFHLKNVEQEELVECDPESEDADVGVLSCGAGSYCIESENSKKGGYCLSSPDEIDRNLQESFFDSVYFAFCDSDSLYYDTCNCTGADPEAYTLDVACARSDACGEIESQCGVNVTSCVSYGFYLTMTGPGAYVVDRCFEDSLPYQQKTCYQTTSYGNRDVEGCTISVDDEECLSCQLSTNADGDDCYIFDCTNTFVKRAGDQCTPGVYVAPILYYVDNFGCDYYVCPICGGDDFVPTNPGGLIDIGDGQTSCAAVHQAALFGAFNETFCDEVVIPGVATPCGCVPFGSPPAQVPTEAPVVTDVTATGTPTVVIAEFPTISPIEVTFPTDVPAITGAASNTFTSSAIAMTFMGVALAFLQLA